MTGVIGPVREVHVWADRAWGLQDVASAEKFDKPHGFYKGIQIVDRFKEEMTAPPHRCTSICGSGQRRRGRSTRRTFQGRAGTAGGTSATAR